MAVVSVLENADGRDGSEDEKFTHKYTRTFSVIVDDAKDGAIVVRQAVGIPRIGDPYVTPNEQDLGSRCISVVPRQDSTGALLFIVVCEYDSTRIIDDIDPLNDPAEISWGASKYKEVIDDWWPYVDGQPDPGDNSFLTKRPVLNSAGEPYLDMPEMDFIHPVLKISRNQLSFDPGLLYLYTNAINSDPFFGSPPRTAKMEAIEAETKVKGLAYYWRVTYEIHFDRDGWDMRILDAGYNQIKQLYKQGGGGEKIRVPIRAKDDGTKHDVPIPLDGKGQPLPISGLGSEPVYNRGRIYYVLPFAPLNLP